MQPMATVTLIGYRGTGKSTVARLLAARLGIPSWDADVELEARVGRSVAALIAERGESAFRDEESAVLASLLERGPGVLATGGGVVLRSPNRDLLRRRGGHLVWLTAEPAVIRRRLAADRATLARRPALVGHDALAEVETVLAARLPLYRDCGAVEVDAGSIPPEAVVERIVGLLAGVAGEER
ncbi:MAG: shikimate kinase [Planctomycetia bacterium]|nr:shikimate kinase [Planctomycetia bacterium]